MALNINGTTGISGVDGSASAASIAGTDANTGLSFASDTVNINTGGSTRATVDSAGRLLIGTTTEGNDNGDDITIGGSGAKGITIRSTDSSNCHLYFSDGTSGTNEYAGYIAYQHSNDSLQFGTGASERFRIYSNGDMSFGISNLSVNSSNAGAVFEGKQFRTSRLVGGFAAVFVAYGSDGYAQVLGDGDLQNSNNSYGAISDETLKQDIVDASSQWDDIKNVRVRKYRFKKNPTGNLQIGVIAQEIEKVSAGLVSETYEDPQTEEGDKVKSVKYSVLYMKAIKALQEAQARIETLETKVAALEAG